jgi:hypothetical protein
MAKAQIDVSRHILICTMRIGKLRVPYFLHSMYICA